MNPMLLSRAKAFAAGAHAAVGQKRKYTGEDYIMHPIAVAELVSKHGGTDAMIAAAYLHDTVEDTAVTVEQICDFFGPEIGMYVSYLTDTSKEDYPDQNRAFRKAVDRSRLAASPREVQMIKCADLIHNTSSITKHDKNFARTYMKEKQLLLDVMTEAKDTSLWNIANELIVNYYKKDIDKV